MSTPEDQPPLQNHLPRVTEEVVDGFNKKTYDRREAIRLMESSDPLASEKLQTYVNGMGFGRDEQMLAYEAAAYLYWMLCQAQDIENQS